MDPTRGQTCTGCSSLSTLPGGNALPTDLLRPYQGYSNINLWEFSAYQNYKALQTSINRRFSKGLMFGVSYTLSSAKGIAGGDWDGARIDGKDKEANYGPLGYDRTHVVDCELRLPGARSWSSGPAGLPDQRLAAVGQLPLRYRVRRTASAIRSPASDR